MTIRLFYSTITKIGELCPFAILQKGLSTKTTYFLGCVNWRYIMIDTVINKELGIQYPIFQGGMAWVADASLASGVSNAGGLGIIAAMNSNG